MTFDDEEIRKEHLRRRAARETETSGLQGMTVNERLSERGLLADWDTAVNRRDRGELVSILKRIEVEDAELVADAVLKPIDATP
jgi:hypothetical protein